jgi:glycerate 2-kinase
MLAPRQLLFEAFAEAVRAADPGRMLAAHLPAPPSGRLLVIGAGKAAASMAAAVERHYGEAAASRLSGLVIVPYGYAEATRWVKVREAGHPVPDSAGVEATSELLSLLEDLGEEDLVLCLISGGASALLCAPAAGLTLADKQSLTQALLRSGAPIEEVNAVRKALSRVKGGRLSLLVKKARLETLILSDVVGDDPQVIGSGPTVAPEGEAADPEALLARHGIELGPQLREALRENRLEASSLEAGAATSRVQVIGSGAVSLEAARRYFEKEGVPAHMLSDRIEGESREVAKVLAAIALSVAEQGTPFEPPCVLLSGGETTVTVQGEGRGGSNTELTLALALQLRKHPGIWALACDTDGSDGGGSNAGALVTPETLTRAAELGLDPKAYLSNNDSFSFFERLGDLVITGPTRTNVNDFRAILIERAR